MSPRININAAILLDCGQKVYQSQWPYADFYEFNTPVMMYLSVIPAWLSAVSGMILLIKQDGDTGLPPRFNIRDYYHFHGIADLIEYRLPLAGRLHARHFTRANVRSLGEEG